MRGLNPAGPPGCHTVQEDARGVVEGSQNVLLRVERSRSRKTAAGRVNAALPLARAGRLVAVLGCAALAAGCSSSSSSSAPSSATTSAAAGATVTVTASAPSSSTTAPGVAACATSALKVTQSAPNGYAGGSYVTIGFTNTSSATCTLYGYPGVSLVSASYAQLGLSAKRVSTVPVKVITLASGATASASVQIVDALNFPSTSCSPVKAAYLRIFPPNQTASVYLANTSETCSKPVQTLMITAVQAGSGSSS
jgi:hypothetical protein